MEDLQSLFKFIYLGETKIVTSMVTSFLEISRELQVEGLTDDRSSSGEEPKTGIKEEDHNMTEYKVSSRLNESNDSKPILEETNRLELFKETVETKNTPDVMETDYVKEVEEPNDKDKLEHTVDLNNVQEMNVNKNVSCTYCRFVIQAQTKKNQEWIMKRHMERVHSRGNLTKIVYKK